MRRESAIPVSILVGSVIVALGLYLGLRASGPSMERGRAVQGAPKPETDDRRPPVDPFTERDRHRAIDDEEADAPPISGEADRGEHPPVGNPEAGMATAVEMPSGGRSSGLAAQVEKDSAEAFEAVRSEARECWNALPDDPEAPSSVALDLSLSYDAEGNVIASGVSEDREARRDGLAQCLGPIVHGMRIPAPGANASVQVRVTVP